MRRLRRNRGMTLIELLVVLAIISVLVGIGYYYLVQTRQSTSQTVAYQQTKELQEALDDFLVSPPSTFNGNTPYTGSDRYNYLVTSYQSSGVSFVLDNVVLPYFDNVQTSSGGVNPYIVSGANLTTTAILSVDSSGYLSITFNNNRAFVSLVEP